MNNDLIIKLSELKSILYPKNIEDNNINKNRLKLILIETLKECIKNKLYKFYIGNYYFDITPDNLSIIYKTNTSNIELSNNDIHFETERDLENNYFIISDTIKDEYSLNEKTILVSGIILNYDNNYIEEYIFNLNSNKEDNIRNYLKLIENSSFLDIDESNKEETCIIKEITKDSKRTNIIDFFNTNVIPVTYDKYQKKYLKCNKEYQNDYSSYLPNMEKEKDNISFIYNTILDFYKEYLDKKV